MLGLLAYLIVVGLTCVWLWRHGAALGILAPLAVGFTLRAAVMIITHLVSAGGGEHGFLYLDDIGYAEDGRLLADRWSHGEFVNPAGFAYAGSYQVVFPALVGGVFTVVGNGGVLAVKLLNVLLGTAAVLMGARVIAAIFGEHAARRGAWLLALAAGVIWWSAPMLKEALVTFLLVAAVHELIAVDSLRSWLRLGILVMILALTRVSAAAALLAAAALAMGVVALRGRGFRRVSLATASKALVALIVVLAGTVLVTAGHPAAAINSFVKTANRMFSVYQGGNIVHLPVDAVKSWVTPYPWIFTSATRNWDRALYPGVWMLYAAAPTALYGIARLRRSPEGVFVVLTIVLYTIVNAAASGFVFRQRSASEVLLVVPVIAGLRAWRPATRAAAVVIALVALPAAVHDRSLVVLGTILLLAAVLALASIRLPETPLLGTVPLPSRWLGMFSQPTDAGASAADSAYAAD